MELGLVTVLDAESLTGAEIGERLSLHPRAVYDFLDTLVALRFLERDGEGGDGGYRNTAETAALLNRRSPHYVGGMREMANDRWYGFWNGLTEALQTGKPQNEAKLTGQPVFDELNRDPGRLEQFIIAMQGISAGNSNALAEKFDFSKYRTVCDVGGANGRLSIVLASHHPVCNVRASTCRSSHRSLKRPSQQRDSATRSPTYPATASRIRVRRPM